ncbi:hypothetical protein PY365_29230 [Roseiarcaceae bacterium H3SJ34-1]|uniref:hypothetical protein n=1 Tax=Terripilifer ovatus TaxID=3032367 RepID=UPI003AB9B875|nr:hypothetical protein [Roseiarcaceae bacterium H3SJ34-1]
MKIQVELISAIALTMMIAGCNTTESVRFQALNASQQTMVRDGQPAIVSKKSKSIVLVSPASRGIQSGARPVYIIGMTNISKLPLDFSVNDVTVTQIVNGKMQPLQVINYDQLVSEERTRQIVGAILVGVAAGANSYAASRAGYGNATIYTPSGTVTANYYSPTAAAIAGANASAQNEAMIANTIENGRRNMSSLEKTVIKDNTLLPGEWYGGQLHFSPPTNESGQVKLYKIGLIVGGELHEIEVTQGPGT